MNFFDSNSYFIDEKVKVLKFENGYRIFNEKGDETGSVSQKMTTGQKINQVMLNKGVVPFHLEIKDDNDELLATIKRGWTLLISTITIEDAQGKKIGSIKQKFKLFKPTFKIYDSSEKLLATIKGDWKAWKFVVNNASDKQIGTINKKWTGLMKEIFTTADKYHVNIEHQFESEESKIAVISSAITIDMVLKNSK